MGGEQGQNNSGQGKRFDTRGESLTDTKTVGERVREGN